MYGIALEGGGARGAYQVGVWKALRELGLEYGGVAGTSVGALNGAMMVQGDLDLALEIWSEIKTSRIMNLDLSPGDASHRLQQFKGIIMEGVDAAPLRLLLGEVIDETRIRASGLVFGFITVSLSNWNLLKLYRGDWSPLRLYIEDVPEGLLIDYLLAGARLPLFRKQYIDGRLVLDGGFHDNLPIDLLVARGFHRIVAIKLGGFGRIRWQERKDVEVTYIKPNESLGGALDFSREQANKNIKLGYFDALKVFRGYHGRRYYIVEERSEEYFLQLLLSIKDDRLHAIKDETGLYSGMSTRRMFLERLVPLTANLLGLGAASSYREVVIALLEWAAAASGLERFQVYSWDEFLEQVVRRYRTKCLQAGLVSRRLPRILKENELLLRALREPLLDRFTTALLEGIKKH